MIYYSDCEYRKIEDSTEAIQSIKILKTYLDDIKVTSQINKFHIQYRSFDGELNAFSSDLYLLNKRLKIAIQQSYFNEFLM